MKHVFKTTIMLLSMVSIVAISCSKEAGEGGTSSISGKIWVRDYNVSFTDLLSEYYAMDERVYIIYGENEYYSEDVRTAYNGTFRFDGLRKGTYEIYTYSKDSTQTAGSGLVPVIRTVEITKNNEQVVLDDIIILN